MSLLPINIKGNGYLRLYRRVLKNPTKITKLAYVVFVPSLFFLPLLFYIPTVLMLFACMLLNVDKRNIKGFLFSLGSYVIVSAFLALRYFPEGIGWIVGVLLYALFVFGLGVGFILIIVYVTFLINDYSPDSNRWQNRKLNFFEFLVSYLALFVAGSFRMYIIVGAATVVFLPIIFYCFDSSIVCHMLSPIGVYMESIANGDYLTKSFIYITIFGAILNYIIYILRKKNSTVVLK